MFIIKMLSTVEKIDCLCEFVQMLMLNAQIV